jgi:hypothetical protein
MTKVIFLIVLLTGFVFIFRHYAMFFLFRTHIIFSCYSFGYFEIILKIIEFRGSCFALENQLHLLI